MNGTEAVKSLIDRLAATPRGAGSEREARARQFCAEYLRRRGFEISEHHFEYSRLPGTLGLPILGTLLLLTGAALVLWASEGGGGLPRGVTTLAALVTVAYWLSFLLFVIRGRSFHAAGTNLVAVRGGASPQLWLSAHIDTKSQPFPTLVRTLAIGLAILVALALVVFYFVDALVADSASIWMILGVSAVVASLPLLGSTVGDDSPGAADNASGVAAVLRAADETGGAPIGVLITTAEELGLAGARAWSRVHHQGNGGHGVIINCDTLDDAGPMRCVYHRRGDVSLARDIARAGATQGIRVRLTRHTPGILLDSVSFAGARIPSVTLSRVSLGTLARIHTTRDSADRLTGEGAAQAAATMVAVIRERA